MDPLLVITNADAGTADRDKLEQALQILRAKASVEVAATSDPGELDGVLHRAASRRIVVAGGDGSVHAVVAALHKRNELHDKVISLLPLGTGNDYARSNDIPLEIEDAARLVLDGEVRPVDLLVDECGEIVVNNVHVGAGAQASRRAHRWKGRLGKVGVGKANLGKLGYPIGGVLAAVKPPYLRLRVEIDGEVVVDLDEPVLLVAVGNGAQVGGGTAITPHADTEDHRVDALVVRSVGALEKLSYAAHLRRGELHQKDDVTYVRASRVSVSGQEFYCSADGEVYGPERYREWHVEPAAYQMTLP